MTTAGQPSPLRHLEPIGHGANPQVPLSDMLERTRLFDDFGRRELELAAGYMQAFRARTGSVIFREGDHESFMCIVVDGRLEALKADDYGVPKQIAVVRPGKTMGEMSIIDGLPRSATAKAMEPTELVVLFKDGLTRMMDDHPRLALRLLWKITQLISLRLRQTSGSLVDFL